MTRRRQVFEWSVVGLVIVVLLVVVVLLTDGIKGQRQGEKGHDFVKVVVVDKEHYEGRCSFFFCESDKYVLVYMIDGKKVIDYVDLETYVKTEIGDTRSYCLIHKTSH